MSKNKTHKTCWSCNQDIINDYKTGPISLEEWPDNPPVSLFFHISCWEELTQEDLECLYPQRQHTALP
jgi:hypothetical protein